MTDFTDMRATVCPTADRAPEDLRGLVYGIGGDAVAVAQRLARRLDALALVAAGAASAVRAGQRLPIGWLSSADLGALIEAAAEYEARRSDWAQLTAAFPETTPSARETTPGRATLTITSNPQEKP